VPVPRIVRSSLLSVVLFLLAGPAWAGLLTLTVVSGLATPGGETTISDPLLQESLSGSTLTQLGTPSLFDPVLNGALGLTVRITNTSGQEIAFPEFLPGISVLTSVSGIDGYSSRTNVAAGGNARATGDGVEGAVSRTVLDMTGSLDVASSPVVGSNGGGGGAGTGVADCWISVTGASGFELAAYLSGLRLAPGDHIDIPDFIRIAAFGRSAESARVAFGFDLPTFSSGGVSVTTTAWTGAFTAPAPPGSSGGDPVAVPEPGAAGLWLAGLAGLCAGGGFRRPRGDRVEERAREVR
jgi:hypothetical protein